MAQKIILKKFGVLSIPDSCDVGLSNQAHQKNKLRIVKSLNHDIATGYITQPNTILKVTGYVKPVVEFLP